MTKNQIRNVGGGLAMAGGLIWTMVIGEGLIVWFAATLILLVPVMLVGLVVSKATGAE